MLKGNISKSVLLVEEPQHIIRKLELKRKRFLSFKTVVLPKANVDECKPTSPGTKNQTDRLSAKRKILEHEKRLEVITEKSFKALAKCPVVAKKANKKLGSIAKGI